MEDYNDDVYLEPTVELSSDNAAAIGQAQEVKVVICESGC
jgi:cytochrome c-type biogenesis protein CcmH/NrfG